MITDGWRTRLRNPGWGVLVAVQAGYLLLALVYGLPAFDEGVTYPYASYVALNALTFPTASLVMPLFFTVVVARQGFTARTGKMLKGSWLNTLVMIPAVALVFKGLAEGWLGHFMRRLDRPLWYLVLEGAAFLLLADLWFYVTHRAFHSRLLYRFHKAHHAHRTPTEAATFLSLSATESYVSGVFMISFPTLVIPVHAHVAIVCSAIVLLSGFYIHAGSLAGAPGLPLFNGPTEHQLHHGRGRKNANYSLVFTVFDRLFGTYAAAEPVTAAAERQPG